MKKYILVPFKQYQDQQRNEDQLRNNYMHEQMDHIDSGGTNVKGNSVSELTNDSSIENAKSPSSHDSTPKDSELNLPEENKIRSNTDEPLNKVQSSKDPSALSNTGLTDGKKTLPIDSSSDHGKGEKRSVKPPSSKSNKNVTKKLKIKPISSSSLSVQNNNGKSQATGNGHFWIKT